MNNTSLDIDRIVREIVDRLRAAVDTEPAGTLLLDQKVITMSQIEGRLDGVRQLVVGQRAVVTPSVRDELSDKNIQLIRSQNK